jgi:NitT/TauT family transport system substrate-binding protein
MAALLLLPALACAAENAKPLRLGHFPNLTHAQALMARATGDFEKKIGVSIKWSSFNAGPTAIEALFGNAIDAVYVGPSPTINGYIKSKGESFVIVAGAASGGAGLVLRGDVVVNDPARDYHDKVIATPQLANTQDVAARIWFSERGYKFKEKGGTLAIVPLANPDQLTMFRRKQIHGAWTVEPWLSRLEIEGGGKLALDEKTLWPDGRYVTTQLVVTRAFLNGNPAVVRKLIAAHVEATQQINADKAAAAKVLNAELKKETGKALKPEVITRAMERIEFTWDPVSTSLVKSAEGAHKLLFLRKPPELKGIYNLEPLNDVLKEKNLPPVEAK